MNSWAQEMRAEALLRQGEESRGLDAERLGATGEQRQSYGWIGLLVRYGGNEGMSPGETIPYDFLYGSPGSFPHSLLSTSKLVWLKSLVPFYIFVTEIVLSPIG